MRNRFIYNLEKNIRKDSFVFCHCLLFEGRKAGTLVIKTLDFTEATPEEEESHRGAQALGIFAFWCTAKTSAEAKIEHARDGLLNSSKLHHQGLPPLYAVLLAPAEVIIYCTAGWIATP